MASKLVRVASLEVENQFELSLRKSFEILEPKLRPPFPLTIPDPEEYSQLNMALVYGVLSEPHFAKIHMKHLHALVTDGYALFSSFLFRIVNELYAKLVDSVKSQLVWVARELIDVSALGIEGLLVSMLRQIIPGDLGEENLQLSFELVSIFLSKWDCLLEEQPLVLTSALYTYLRLLADHCRPINHSKLDVVRRLEIEFCVKMLREQFHLCLRIGRDLIRLLRDLVPAPDFGAIWKDLVSNPSVFRAPEFSDISKIYQSRTSSKYFLLRITPEMETQLRFMLTHVKLGAQKRHQAWFAKKFLSAPESETLLIDIVRFICCGHHPSNQIIQSDIIPRWAVIGWLLKLCRKNHVEANVKLALLYDWLFFDERVDNIMNIEPAILLMVYSIPQYVELTHALLEYLFFLLDNYDVDRRDIIVKGMSSAFKEIVRRGVVSTLGVLTMCPALSPFLREKLEKFLLGSPNEVSGYLKPAQLPNQFRPLLGSPNISPQKILRRSPERLPLLSIEENGCKASHADASAKITDFVLSSASAALPNTQSEKLLHSQSLVESLGKTTTQLEKQGLQNLEAVLLSFVRLDDQKTASDYSRPEVLASKLATECEMTGYRLFAPLLPHADGPSDDEVSSVTALIIRTFCFSQRERIQQMLLYWLHCGLPVGARIFSYAARLAYEAKITGSLQNGTAKSDFAEISVSCSPLLKYHVDGYFSFQNQGTNGLTEAVTPTSKIGKVLAVELVQNAFSAYKSFLTCIKTTEHNATDLSLSKLLSTDLRSCCDWAGKNRRYLVHSAFTFLPELSTGSEDIIRLLMGQVDHVDLLNVQLDIRLQKFSVFGGNADIILDLIKKSLDWDILEQHRLWGLLRSEAAVSCIHLEKIVLEFFCSHESKLNLDAIAVEGLLTLLSSSAPTPQLVGALMLLPNNASADFASAVLSSWEASDASFLFNSFAKFFETFEDNTNPIVSASSGIMLNSFVISWFLNHFRSKEIDVSDVLSNSTPGNPV